MNKEKDIEQDRVRTERVFDLVRKLKALGAYGLSVNELGLTYGGPSHASGFGVEITCKFLMEDPESGED